MGLEKGLIDCCLDYFFLSYNERIKSFFSSNVLKKILEVFNQIVKLSLYFFVKIKRSSCNRININSLKETKKVQLKFSYGALDNF